MRNNGQRKKGSSSNYESKLGRFITRDTFEGFEDDPLSQNLYAYAKNNPVKYVDPDGHNPAVWAVRLALKGIAYWFKKYGVPLFRATWHLGERMVQRGISPLEVAKTLRYGKKYYDPKYKYTDSFRE